jgi:signal transduction histidine kinase
MIQESIEKRSEFRFPINVPVEYFKSEGSGISSYTLDLSKNGTFISSDNHPIDIGTRFGMNLNLPVDQESARFFRTEGTVVWNRMQLFKSKNNGMGVQFIKPLSEPILLNVLANNAKILMEETEENKVQAERVENLESELERVKRLASLGRYAEKILIELSNPILTLSGRLDIIKIKMDKHKGMLEEHVETNKKKFKKIITEFNNCCKEVDQILEDYKVLSELIRIAGNDRETIEKKLQRYNG